jgi:iron complex outermembrane receptor protein
MKKYIVISIIILQNINIFAQKIQILNSENKQPVPFVSIYFPDLKTGGASDENGFFSAENHQKTVLMQISSVGYKTFLENVNIQRDTVIFIEPSTHDLQEIIISAVASKLQGENVANVEQITLNNTEIQGFNLTEKLKNIVGLDNFSTGTGIGKPVIRGLSGNRIAVFSQGVRIENQQWGDEHGLGLDENGYEHAEIIKGAASLLYGSDALGGVLYFADERFAKQNSVEANLISEYQTNTNGFRNAAALKFSKKRFHANFFGGYTQHYDYSDGNNNAVINSRFRTADFKTSAGFTGKNFVSSLKYNFLAEKYGLLPEDIPEILPKKNSFLMPFQIINTHIISTENTIFFENNSKLKIDLGYVINGRREFGHEHEEGEEHGEEEHGEHEEAALNMSLHTFSYNVKWDLPDFKRWKLIAGSQGMLQSNKNYGEEILIPDTKTMDLGLFAVSNFHYSQKAYWQAGIRFDSRKIEHQTDSKNYFSFNFSTGIFQPLAKNLSMRLNLSSGFRAPNMFELFSDGIHEGVNRYERGNYNLKTENTYQADFSLNYASKHLEIFVNPYFNFVKDYICLQPADSIVEGVQVFDYVQNNAILYGGEAGFHFHPHPLDWLHLDGSYASTFGKTGDYAKQPLALMPSQKIKAQVQTIFNFKRVLTKFSAFVHYQYSFAQNRIALYEMETPDYHLISCGVNFNFLFGKQKLFVNISANNLLNEKYFDHLSRYKSEGILNIGRNIICRISVPFEFKM